MARVTYGVPQPVQPPDGVPLYVKAEIQRANNAAGVPSTWSTIATITGDPSARFFYRYEDDSAAATFDNWYRHRFTDVAVAAFSDYSVEVQIDEFIVILWLLADITDADVTIDDVTQWCNQAIVDLWPDIWLPVDDTAIIPWDSDADGYTDEQYDIPATLEEVWRVEKVVKRATHAITAATNATPIVVTSAAHGFAAGDRVYITDVLGNTATNGSWLIDTVTTDTFVLVGSAASGVYTSGGSVRKAGTRHVAWLYHGTEWMQQGRRIRFFGPTTGYDYVLHGKGRYRDITDLTETLHQLIYWMVRAQYLDFRTNQRANAPRFLALERKNDTTPEQLQRFLVLAQQNVESRLERQRQPDYPTDIES